MKNITNMTNNLWTWVKLSVFTFPLFVFVSCSQEECLPQETTTLQFVVSDFPAFGEDPETRAIGTQDEGKIAWEAGDEIIVTLDGSQKYGTQTAAITYDGSEWTMDGSLQYLENETPTVSAIYAPCYEVKGNTMNMKTGMQLGMTEYLEAANCTLKNGIISISFEGVTRDYSRLRLAGLAGETYTITTTGFTPAGAASVAAEAYTLTADVKGNTYLYGTFAKDATVGTYTFTTETEQGRSYALEAYIFMTGTFIDGTSTDTDAIYNTIKASVDNGTTTIIVTGSESAIIETDSYTITAIGEAIYRLSQDASYYGKIDLIIPNVTKIIDEEFAYAYALNSITLPKVTKLGDMAFNSCDYLTKLTFGSVLTEVNETTNLMFGWVGEKVDGCDLILNCGQMNESSVSTPDLTANTWTFKWENSFKSITLTHTGENSECDECKAIQ